MSVVSENFEYPGTENSEIHTPETAKKSNTSNVKRSPQDNIRDALNRKAIRNVIIIAHVDHGKTTLTDHLIAAGRLMSKDRAGEARLTDSRTDQKQRGITIKSGSVSVPFKDNVVTILDSPGHHDFGAERTKGARSVDGALLLIDVKEGVKPQTEAVIALAVKEKLPIILVLNKIDRLIMELASSPREIHKRILKVLDNVNLTIAKFKTELKKSDELNNEPEQEAYFDIDKNVLFGSGLNGWMASVDTMRAKNQNFKDILLKVKNRDPTLKEDFALAEVVLEKVISHIKPPMVAQKEKLRAIFQEEDIPEDLLTDPSRGPLRLLVCDRSHSKQTGILTTVRVLSGTLSKGKLVYSNHNNYTDNYRISRLYLDLCRTRLELESAPTGSIVTLSGLDIPIGSTLIEDRTKPFAMPCNFNKSQGIVSFELEVAADKIEALKEALYSIASRDPSFTVDISDKRILVSGVGELHIETVMFELKETYGLDVKISKPRVNYYETIENENLVHSGPVRTPNKLSDFQIAIRRLPSHIHELLMNTVIDRKKLNSTLELHGYDKESAKKCEGVLEGGSLYINDTKGASYMSACREELMATFNKLLRHGLTHGRPVRGVEVRITFAKIHGDVKMRGEAQYSKAFRAAFDTISKAGTPLLLEPVVKVLAILPGQPTRYINGVIKHLDNLRGDLQDTREAQIPGYLELEYQAPVASTFGLNKLLMTTCEGRLVLSYDVKGYKEVPSEIIASILNSDSNKNTNNDTTNTTKNNNNKNNNNNNNNNR